MEVVQLIGAPLDTGFRELRLQEVEKQSCVIDRVLDVLPQPPAQTCCSAPMALFMWIGTSQVGSWPYSFQSAMEVQWKLLTLWNIWRYAQDGFVKVSQPSTDVKGRLSVLNCWSILMLSGRAFLSQIVNEPETKRQSVEWHHQQSPRRKSSRQLLALERFWSLSFETLMEWFWWMWWPEVRQSIRMHTSKPSKNWNSVTGECGLTGIQETCWFSATVPAFTQVNEPRRQSPNLIGLCSPIPPIVLIWRCQIFIFLGHWRMHCVGQGLKMTRSWFVQWGHGYVNRKQGGKRKACTPLFRAGIRP